MGRRSGVVASGLLSVAARLFADTDPTYSALRAALPAGPALAVQGLRLERDVFRFEFEKGTFARLGLVNFGGSATASIDTTLSLPKKPRRVVANAKNDVLSRD